jgi:uncharacterized membrane protein YgcG
MKRKLLSITITALLAAMAGYSANVIAAKGSPGPPPGVGGGGGEGEETTGNNLAYPAMLFSSDGATSKPYAFTAAEGTFKTNYSYGCAKPEKVGSFEYPNTSCVTGWKEDGTAIDFLDAAACVADNAPCAGLTVDRIYWQKVSGNVWNAQSAALGGSATVRFVDWGDSIESVTWGTSSILRVETQGYADLSVDPRDQPIELKDQNLDDGIPALMAGVQMWHSQGHGITEQWGARVTEAGGAKGSPYVYGSPYAIVNAGTASLYLSKMESGSSTCPTEYAGRKFETSGWTGSGWTGACNLPVVPYTVELSVTGKYVHGYNWRMRELPTLMQSTAFCSDMTGEWNKAGWWRLTFVPNGGIAKMRFGNPNTIGPPVTPSSEPATLAVTAEEEGDTGPLYQPVVVPYEEGNPNALNLTYIDICISSKTGGGGGGGGKGGGGGGGPPTGGGGGSGGGGPRR